MAFNPRMFEHVYGSNMLDTVHNYFPEMMYDDTLFQDQTIRWMRYRISTLFPQQYAEKQNEYRIYQSVNRRGEFANWNSVHIFEQLRPTTIVPPYVASPVRTTVRTSVINIPPPLGPSTGANEEPPTIPPPQTPQQPPRVRAIPVVERRTHRTQRALHEMDGLVNTFFGGLGGLGMMDGEYEPVVFNGENDAGRTLLNLLATATLLPTNTAFQDVVVAPTQAQIDAGSTIVNYADLPRDTSCAICQEDTGDSAWRRLHCNHYFHRGCVDPWFERNTHCPVCRADIREPETNNE